MYYSAAEQLAHHAIGGCGMNVGDLLGSGTISGPERGEYGSLMELSWAGRDPFTLETGETRTFIEDGDTLTLRGAARGDGFQIGFGDCSGQILPAVTPPARAKHK
jgi:fumarylacetoacetase